ncbi:hypothetical protein [Bifidobacterium samirii]|nr:hypothetical protein [Bifidobacterium samirii]
MKHIWQRIRTAYVSLVPEAWTYRICAAVAVLSAPIIGLVRLSMLG